MEGIAGSTPAKLLLHRSAESAILILPSTRHGKNLEQLDCFIPNAFVRLGCCMAINRHCGLEIHRLLVGVAPAHWSIDDRTSAGAERKQL